MLEYLVISLAFGISSCIRCWLYECIRNRKGIWFSSVSSILWITINTALMPLLVVPYLLGDMNKTTREKLALD